MGKPLEPEVAKTFDEFWRGIVMKPDGTWDIDQIKRELHDYHVALSEVPKVYCEITGNAMSKVNYLADEVIRVHDERCPHARDLQEMVRRVNAVFADIPPRPRVAHVIPTAGDYADRVREILIDYVGGDIDAPT